MIDAMFGGAIEGFTTVMNRQSAPQETVDNKASLDEKVIKGIAKMDAISALDRAIVGGGANELQARKAALQAQKEALEEEKTTTLKETEKYKKAFQEKIFFKPVPVAGPLSTLQDFALAIFAVGWVLLSAVVVSMGIFQPGGSWKRGTLLAVLMFILTVVVQSLISSYL